MRDYRVYDAKGDLTKKWYVYVVENSKITKKYYQDFNKIQNKKKRLEALQLFVNKLKDPVYEFQELLNLHKERMKPKGFGFYNYFLNSLRKYLILSRVGGDIVGDPTSDEVQKWYYLEVCKKSKTTQAHAIGACVWFYSKLKKESPLLDVVRPKVCKVPFKAFSDHDRMKLAALMLEEDFELYLFTRFIMYAFIRPEELRQLKLSAIDIKEETITVPGAISKNSMTQTVHLVPPLKKILIEHNVLTNKTITDPIFTALDGKVRHAQYFRRKHVAYLKKHGYDTAVYKLYSWKHTGNIAAVKSNISHYYLQKQNRHATFKQTEDYYRALGVMELKKEGENFPT